MSFAHHSAPDGPRQSAQLTRVPSVQPEGNFYIRNPREEMGMNRISTTVNNLITMRLTKNKKKQNKTIISMFTMMLVCGLACLLLL